MTILRDQIGADRADQCAAAKLHRRRMEDSRRLMSAIFNAARCEAFCQDQVPDEYVSLEEECPLRSQHPTNCCRREG